jgi:hypothetical protein
MRRLTAGELHAQKVAELGLDATALDLTSTEAIAGALRRAAGFLCPCSGTTLVRAVSRPLEGLVPDMESLKQNIEETLETLTAHGDLLEHRDVAAEQDAQPGTLLYAAPPSFVRRESGAVLILGIAPQRLSPLPDELEKQIRYVNHVRRLPGTAAGELAAELAQLGLVELSLEVWLRAPGAETAAQHLARLGGLLDAAAPSLEIPGLNLIDPTSSVRYYRGRWVQPRAQTGRFVGRRSQAYGADLWCYVEMDQGRPRKFLDLPLRGSRARGCDEAWRLQAAIDAQRGASQRFRVRQGPMGSKTKVIDFFSPVPMWARRRWDAVGEPVVNSGCLFSYCFLESEIDEELRFVHEKLWLAELTEGERK